MRGSAEVRAARFAEPPKGEIVIVVGPAAPRAADERSAGRRA